MKIAKIYKNKTAPVFSFEFFPPKTPEGDEKLVATVTELKALNPGYISVTYGAGGSTKDKTIDLCSKFQSEMGITAMCHFTCVGASRNEIRENLKLIQSRKIDNIIALRGDPPKGEGVFKKHPDGFANATELIGFIKEEGFDFGLAGGAYPEKHPDSPTLELDIEYLKMKVDAGAEFLLTQLFFVNSIYASFLEKTKKAGIHVPIIPGIMPITSFNQIQRFKEIANCEIPMDLVLKLEKVKNNSEEFDKISRDYTVQQCDELLKMGVDGIHFYTLNQSKSTIKIMKELI